MGGADCWGAGNGCVGDGVQARRVNDRERLHQTRRHECKGGGKCGQGGAGGRDAAEVRGGA